MANDTKRQTGRPRDLLRQGSAEPFRAIVADAADAIVGMDEQQRIVLFNRAAETMFGHSTADAIGQPLAILLPEAVRARHDGHVQAFCDGIQHSRYMGQRQQRLSAVRADGAEFAVAITIAKIATDDGPLLVAHVRDISERIALLDQQVRLATHDPLTGALNRRALLDRAKTVHRRFLEQSVGYGVLMLDLDHFKAINDTHGHAAGDRVLKGFASLCARTLRSDDVFARWGGEEFVAILPGADPSHAQAVAERIRLRTARRTGDSSGKPLRATVSIGVAVARPGRSFDDVLRRADEAVYAAKTGGRDRVAFEAQRPPLRRSRSA